MENQQPTHNITSIGNDVKGLAGTLSQISRRIETEKNFKDTLNAQILENFLKLEEKLDSTRSEIRISPPDKKLIAELQAELEKVKRISRAPIVASLIAGLIMAGTGFLAIKFYGESIKTKQEVRADIERELAEKGNVTVTADDFESQQSREKGIEEWRKANPKDSRSFDEFLRKWELQEAKKL